MNIRPNSRGRYFFVGFSMIFSLSMFLCSCKGITILEEVEKKSEEYVFKRAEAVMEAYYDADFKTITELSNGKFSEIDFLDAGWSGSEPLFNALTEGKDWEVNRESAYAEPVFCVEVKMEHADLTSVIDNWLSGDEEFTSMLACRVQLDTGEISTDEFYSIYYKWLAENYPEKIKEAGTISFSIELMFKYDDETDEWYLSELPTDFTLCSNRSRLSPLGFISDDDYNYFLLNVARQMVYDKEMLEKEYYDLYEFYYERCLTPQIVPVSDVIDALDYYGFVDPETLLPIDAPPMGADRLKFVIFFTERFEEVAFYYRLYKDSAIPENLVKGDLCYFTDLWSDNIVIFDDQLWGLEPGEYIFRVQLENEGIVLEDAFTVEVFDGTEERPV